MKIYVIRHGQTPWNVMKRLQGRSDIDLNDKGREAAILTGKAFAHVDFYMAFTSPLKRARETAELFLEDRKIPVVADERIQEISFGAYEGMTYGADNYQIPDPDFMNFFKHPEKYFTPPGGESLQELGQRTREFMEDIINRPELQNRNILVFSHGCASRGILNSIRTFEPWDFWHGGVPKNCSVALIEAEHGKARLCYENKVFY